MKKLLLTIAESKNEKVDVIYFSKRRFQKAKELVEMINQNLTDDFFSFYECKKGSERKLSRTESIIEQLKMHGLCGVRIDTAVVVQVI